MFIPWSEVDQGSRSWGLPVVPLWKLVVLERRGVRGGVMSGSWRRRVKGWLHMLREIARGRTWVIRCLQLWLEGGTISSTIRREIRHWLLRNIATRRRSRRKVHRNTMHIWAECDSLAARS